MVGIHVHSRFKIVEPFLAVKVISDIILRCRNLEPNRMEISTVLAIKTFSFLYLQIQTTDVMLI